MSKFVKSLIIATSIAGVSLSSVATSQAHDIHKRHHHRHVTKKHNSNDAVVWGIIGLAAGAIIANSANNHRKQRTYRQPQQTHNYVGKNHYPQAPTPRYRSNNRRSHTSVSYEPWSQNWYNYCAGKYRSFNANKGTYRGYDGKDHFCVAK